jgi:hypothetical protein
MDCQAISFTPVTQCGPAFLPHPLSCPAPASEPISSPAKQMAPQQRQALSVEAIAGMETVSKLAREHQVSRKFVYRQVQTAERALEHAFAPAPIQDEVLFHLPVTKPWLEQLVLGLVLTCHSSYRGVVELLGDVFDYRMSTGTVHNIVHGTVAQAQKINQRYDLSGVRFGAHDEIFQGRQPVLVGVDTNSTFCYLLSLEEHRDAETWGLRLLELMDRSFSPQAIITDGGSGLRAGQELACPKVACWGDNFHLTRDLETLVRFLEDRAYRLLETCQKLCKRRDKQRDPRRRRTRKGSPASTAQCLRHASLEAEAAISLADDVALLMSWLRHDILSVAGPSYAQRLLLYDFVVAELQARVRLCPDKLEPVCRSLKKHREEFLAFAQEVDEGLNLLAEQFQCSAQILRGALQMLCRDERDPRRWMEESALRQHLGSRSWEAFAAVDGLRAATVRASSMVENLNGRLRCYFFLRRHLGAKYLSLLQFFLNHRRFQRSERAERVGKTPAELLTGCSHSHWLEMLGYSRFQRN